MIYSWNNLVKQAFNKAMQAKHAALALDNYLEQTTDLHEAVYCIPKDRLILRCTEKTAEIEKLRKNIENSGILTKISEEKACFCTSLQNKNGDFVVVFRQPISNKKVANFVKNAEIEFLHDLGSLIGWNDSLIDLPGYPSPAAATLGSGLLGAGVGYTSSVPASMLLPKDWNKKKFRRLATILSAAAGASVALPFLIGAINSGQNPFDKSTILAPERFHNKVGMLLNVPELHNILYNDPILSQQLAEREKALTSGLLTSSALLKGSPYVSPVDVGKLTMSMGTGYLSGALVGKALGLLAGAPESVQDKLKETGMYAGVIKRIIPDAFR